MSKELIRLRDLCMAYDDELVLDHLNLYINDKEFLTLLGPSGCGKSTTLRIIGGFTMPTSGDVLFDGVRINDVPPYRRQINTVFQRYALFPHLNVFENVAFGLRIPKADAHGRKVKVSEQEIHGRVMEMLETVNLKGFEKRPVSALSGGQQQRVAIARALVNRPRVLLLDEPLGALDMRLRKDMQNELKRIQQEMEITFIYVTHDQEEALAMSDTVVVMDGGRIQQIGTPEDIYNEPKNAFVADFIGESNIIDGVMRADGVVEIFNRRFQCLDKGFGKDEPVDVVIRPEDIYIFDVSDAAQLTGTVTSCIFKGVHYEMLVQTREGYELMVQDYHAFEAGREVGLLVKPFDIHVMKKERTCNTFEGKLVDETHVEFLGCNFECLPVQEIEPGSTVQVEVDFQHVILEDNEEDGRLTGEVKFILYKGNHYHLTVFTDWDEDIFVDTNDVWDDSDRVGITIAPENIRIVQSINKEGSAQ